MSHSQRRLPQDPQVRALVQAMGQRSYSRRSVLSTAGALGLTGLLAACGTGGSSSGTKNAEAVKDISSSDPTVNWANWTLYLDYDEKKKTYPTLDAFTKQSGIKVNYVEDIDGNDSYYGKVQGQLKAGQDIGQDIITLTDWMAGRLIRQGYTQELNLANIPNSANLLPSLQEVDFDPGRKHSLTWQSGYAGIAWNKKAFPKGMKSVEDLWDPSLKGRITVLDEMRDTIGLLMMQNGVDIAGDWGENEFGAATDLLRKNIDNGQIRQVKGNSYKQDFISGDAIAGIVWSGDIVQMNFENDDQWEFIIPEAGGTLWSDNMMVPVGSPRKTNAEKLMDFYYDPAVAAEVAAYVNFICPVEGAKEEMEKIDPELVGNPLIFPTDVDLAKAHVFRSLEADEETTLNSEFQSAIGA
ncbi:MULTISPECIES: ABC transporter substrate-binding protein [Glutamicibacter]|uniref:Spermidine/putrescine ABC transporter substrate-binding protein n=2 Tax=Glutamicibacter arilaitensis TaxID=256701 RepID=A0A2N7S1T8_9MICC|nr:MULTISPECIES: spermidine/putrescine ABC transporter substrate-binding protein [Glutamicibacter]PMQ20118.1 spermidine/putrescine ABC transporter substrate-binding protein [Glutamicibacter arilaitensis]CBT76801.1 polyamine ABC transporter, substrate-binding protein [Glutamicibacter arilaitensis Re117]HCH46855.1 spermidine/putrescine ABC transporter substrate-binding protein [Glutamicibacter sp.]HCJ53296.1 spermidine/putrescine ABC transporter substrate-binding protein [Glutamicibacter sp.]HCM